MQMITESLAESVTICRNNPRLGNGGCWFSIELAVMPANYHAVVLEGPGV